MEIFKKIVTHWAFTAAIGLLLGAGVTFALLQLVTVQPLRAAHADRGRQIDELTEQLATREEELASVNSELADTKASLSAVSEQLDTANEQMNLLEGDIEAKQTELEQMRQEAENVKKDLSDNQQALEKAKRGVERLANLDKLFTQFENQSNELNAILTRYYTAVENGETNMAIGYADQYNNLAVKVEDTYTQITTLLAEFRSGRY